MSARFSPAHITPTLPLQVAERIGQSIIDEQFPPGERLKEVELALSFGVSRATVREALRILEKRGLVSILPQRGARVNDLSPKELEDLFEIRAALLGVASRRLAERGSDEDRRQIREGLRALEAALDDASAYARASAKLVATITRLSGNDQIDSYIGELSQRFARYARLGLASRERRDESIATWRKLLRAIVAKDGETAEAIHRKLALRNLAAGLEQIEQRKK